MDVAGLDGMTRVKGRLRPIWAGCARSSRVFEVEVVSLRQVLDRCASGAVLFRLVRLIPNRACQFRDAVDQTVSDGLEHIP